MWFFDLITLILTICTIFGLYHALKWGHQRWMWLQKSSLDQKHQTFFLENEAQLMLQFSTLLQAGHAPKQPPHHLSKSHAGNLFSEQLLGNTQRTQAMEFAKLCFDLAQSKGISLVPLFTHLSSSVQSQKNLKERLSTLTFPLKAQAITAICIPFFVLLCFCLLDQNLLIETFHTWTGWVGFTTALVLELGAFLWIKKILVF